MKILVTVNLDVLTYAGNLENLAEIEDNPRYTFVKGDVADRDMVESIVSDGVDVIVNFAAETHVDRSIHDPGVFVRTNVMGTQMLLDTAKAHNVSRYIQVSTDEVYGALGATGMFTEQMPLSPNSPYSASKAGADMLVRAYGKTFGLSVNITRCSNNYGPYQFPEKLIPLMIANALEDKDLPVYGDGMQVRDWLHVKDHCRAIDTVLRKGIPGEIYNVGGNNEKANIEIVNLILDTLEKPESLIKHVTDRPGHDRRYAIDNTKITTKLGWLPSYTFEEGMKETIEWYLQNRNWWERIRSGDYQAYYERMYGNR
jgi:dTDP-glucose 4,6-dehydratase